MLPSTLVTGELLSTLAEEARLPVTAIDSPSLGASATGGASIAGGGGGGGGGGGMASTGGGGGGGIGALTESWTLPYPYRTCRCSRGLASGGSGGKGAARRQSGSRA
jgi:hypothetical protein